MSLQAAITQIRHAEEDLQSDRPEINCALYHVKVALEDLNALFAELYPDHPSSKD